VGADFFAKRTQVDRALPFNEKFHHYLLSLVLIRKTILLFYFRHMKYGKYWFHLQIFFIANFHVLELFIKTSLERQKYSVCHAALPSFFIANFLVLGLFIPKKSDAQVGRVNTFIILHTK
jgi:hypothetical protein